MPQTKYMNWSFVRERPIDEGILSMTKAVANYGIPFMRSHDDLGKIIEKMTRQQPWGWPDVIKFHLPVALAIAGRRAEADQYIERKLREYGDAQHAAAEQFRSFAAQFSNWKPENVLASPP